MIIKLSNQVNLEACYQSFLTNCMFTVIQDEARMIRCYFIIDLPVISYEGVHNFKKAKCDFSIILMQALNDSLLEVIVEFMVVIRVVVESVMEAVVKIKIEDVKVTTHDG